MASAGFTINVLTMLALILAIGLVMDDAIIVLENIYARLEEGLPQVGDRIPLLEPLSPEAVRARFEQDNRELEAARQREAIARFELAEVERERYPTIALQVGYDLARDARRVGPYGVEGSRGFRIGIGATLPIFDGFERRRRAQAAEVHLDNQRIEADEVRTALEVALRSELTSYTTARSLVELEEENLELAAEALRISLERFRAGSITSVQLRETQRILIDTEIRLIDTHYEAKTSETELLRMSGGLGEAFGF